MTKKKKAAIPEPPESPEAPQTPPEVLVQAIVCYDCSQSIWMPPAEYDVFKLIEGANIVQMHLLGHMNMRIKRLVEIFETFAETPQYIPKSEDTGGSDENMV